eukprot:m.324493 g.324493  ORF g.324493 m.324493 type:complete len:242 (-) comp33583_c0_seq1:19-744(-)
MPKKKAGGKKKGGKKGGKKKEKKVDPAKVKAENDAKARAEKEIAKLEAGVAWIDKMREWTQRFRAQILDSFRNIDSDVDGLLSADEVRQAMQQLRAPLKDSDLESFVMCVDLDNSGSIRYLTPPETIKAYGGGVQELVEKGLERILLANKQDKADITKQLEREIISIHGGVPPPASDDEEGGGDGGEGGEGEGDDEGDGEGEGDEGEEGEGDDGDDGDGGAGEEDGDGDEGGDDDGEGDED